MKNIAAGVAQGSKSGPILFCCYINGIPKQFNTLHCMYADDTAILAKNNNPNFIQIALNRHIKALEYDPHYDCSAVQERLRFRQQRQHKYDLHFRPLKPLQENQEVVFHLNNQWCKGKVSRVRPQPRTTAEDSFMAPTSSNRTNNPAAQTHLSVSNSFPVVTQTHTPVCNTARTTRTGRTIIPPQRFMDYE
ncbi:hypothetical protein AVEN_224813-1 [Araneus ventricosus]|uniref:Reverse transcriptase domain-containing protein n=1 Tax=Araneus ventricosus TaxID=182803 RepID=A0A4Y2FZ06_ARAVE|nr:hypothetical protein AVEN_224813-1 [Araneus ventricosus]